MTELVVINHKNYHSIREASKAVPYSSDYITRLAREQKVKAVQLSRRWYVSLESLQAYEEVRQHEQLIRKKMLREERLHERIKKQLVQRADSNSNFLHVERYVLATVTGVFSLGIIVGSQMLIHPQTPNVAAVNNSTSLVHGSEKVIDSSQSEIKVNFSESSDGHALVEGGRFVNIPNFQDSSNQEGWHYVHHE